MNGTTPLISCLCVTEGRPEFIPWLLWCYDRQTWERRELIIVDSSPKPCSYDREDVQVIAEAPGTRVAAKRNRALAAARGDRAAPSFFRWSATGSSATPAASDKSSSTERDSAGKR